MSDETRIADEHAATFSRIGAAFCQAASVCWEKTEVSTNDIARLLGAIECVFCGGTGSTSVGRVMRCGPCGGRGFAVSHETHAAFQAGVEAAIAAMLQAAAMTVMRQFPAIGPSMQEALAAHVRKATVGK